MSAHLLPLSVDGLVVVASVSLVELADRLQATADPAPGAAVHQPAAHRDADADTPGSPVGVVSDWSTPAAAAWPAQVAECQAAQGPDQDAVRAGTAAAVAYWRRRDPTLPAAVIAERIGRSERTVRRYWQPTRRRREPAPAGA